MKFRVINPESTHYGEVGSQLDKDAVKRTYGNSFGRSDAWYADWEVLLDLGDTGDAGTGFYWHEIEVAR